MSLFNRIQEDLILPASDLISGLSISGALKFVLDSQYRTNETLVKYQEERLRTMVKHAYENVPFYHNLFKEHHIVPSDIKIIEDLHKVPVISKKDMRKHPADYYQARNIPIGKCLRLNSSGSTGEPFTYFITAEAFSMNYACALRGWYWMGYRLGETYSKLSQNPRKGLRKKIQDLITRSQYIFIRDLTPEALANVIKKLNEGHPDFIRCYPDPLLFLANLINEGHELRFSPKAINTTGNILTPESRKKIEEAFGTSVFDSYSCEASAQFFQGPQKKGYFASMEYAITEVIDDMNNPSCVGRHITTDLWNLAMPFIRYDTQDIIERSDSQNDSGIGLMSFNQIMGRNSDILVTPSGKFLIVHTFTIFFEYFEEILQFQVTQYEPDKVKVLLVVNDQYNTRTERAILEGLIDLIGKDVNIEICPVTQIPLLASGKRRFIIREDSIKIQF